MNDYSRVAHLFVELRGKGLSLAAADLAILQSWKRHTIPPVAIVDLMYAIAEECEEGGRGFPLTLGAVDTRLRRALRDGSLKLGPDPTLGETSP